MEAFSETGTEGTHWCLYDTTKTGYSGLVNLEQGLTIFSYSNNDVVWQGVTTTLIILGLLVVPLLMTLKDIY